MVIDATPEVVLKAMTDNDELTKCFPGNVTLEPKPPGLFTGIREVKLRSDFGIPNKLSPTIIVGFGYPARRLIGKSKKRLPLDKLVYYEKYGSSKISAAPDSWR